MSELLKGPLDDRHRELGANFAEFGGWWSFGSGGMETISNQYAAMPSLHVGWNLIVGIAVYRVATRRPARLFGVLSPVLMSLAVVVTANHYVVDALAGAALVVRWRRPSPSAVDPLR